MFPAVKLITVFMRTLAMICFIFGPERAWTDPERAWPGVMEIMQPHLDDWLYEKVLLGGKKLPRDRN